MTWQAVERVRGQLPDVHPENAECLCAYCSWTRDTHAALSLLEDTLEAAERVRADLEERWRKLLEHADESDGTGEHVGFARYYRAKADGYSEALKVWDTSLAAALDRARAGGEA